LKTRSRSGRGIMVDGRSPVLLFSVRFAQVRSRGWEMP
jgi:hypothetical protein